MRALSTACLSLAFGLLSITASSAQFADPRVALSGRNGAMTCGEFSHLSPRHRDAVIRGLNASAPPRSLAGTPGNIRTPGSRQTTIENSSTMSGTSLSVGALVAACQASAPGESLRAAYDAFDSNRVVTVRRHHR